MSRKWLRLAARLSSAKMWAMPIYLNEGFPPAPSGREWKHLRPTCPLLLDRAAEGYAVKPEANPDDGIEDTALHKYERCGVCFKAGKSLAATPLPAWLESARQLQSSPPDGVGAYVYEIVALKARYVHLGKARADEIYTRLKNRWDRTCKSRWGRDCVPWMYDLVAEGRRDEIELVLHRFPTEKAAVDAEKRMKRDYDASGEWKDVSGGLR